MSPRHPPSISDLSMSEHPAPLLMTKREPDVALSPVAVEGTIQDDLDQHLLVRVLAQSQVPAHLKVVAVAFSHTQCGRIASRCASISACTTLDAQHVDRQVAVHAQERLLFSDCFIRPCFASSYSTPFGCDNCSDSNSTVLRSLKGVMRYASVCVSRRIWHRLCSTGSGGFRQCPRPSRASPSQTAGTAPRQRSQQMYNEAAQLVRAQTVSKHTISQSVITPSRGTPICGLYTESSRRRTASCTDIVSMSVASNDQSELGVVSNCRSMDTAACFG